MLLVITGEHVQMVHKELDVDPKKNSVLVPMSESTNVPEI
jgi:hypothetical protein